ncbi:sorbosone dehydrogenase family protein [Actinotalea sp. K2]|uniref:PQQ-dependent sugar dehydrogenase n=1 Tax=Actinotalea sp. K2 TaxID=2939438 RepID=UPI00201837B2|nr:PQQ-dependent sugar dehydrogenase [Actinotalea sp. K2]MCL3861263.1 PQQ-dependent sugar dehydrogenase [Actinotalea sp. K2]
MATTLAAGLLLVGCAPASPDPTPEVASPAPSPAPSLPSREDAPEPDPSPEPPRFPAGPDLGAATDTPQDLLTGLAVPWGLAFLPSGAVLITQRDAAVLLLLTSTGLAPLTGPGAEELAATTTTAGEGGLLGVAVSPQVEDDGWVYLYRTTANGNEVVRGQLDADAGALGELQTVVGGIPAASNHNGGRLAFGPDGFLYVATGDASDRGTSRDDASLAGKILRVTAGGEPAPGNPVPGSPVWSLGHRNVQGLGWDERGRLFASEFGQNAVDELNLIEPGADYGWPEVEGSGGGPGLVDPVVEWAPAAASPSGIAVTADAVYVAALRGARLWVVPFEGDGLGEPVDVLVGELGRLRDVVVGPDGALWILTQNTDGRGQARPGDDRLVRMLPP